LERRQYSGAELSQAAKREQSLIPQETLDGWAQMQIGAIKN